MKRQPNQPNECLICLSPAKLFLSDLFDDRYGAPGRHSVYRCVRCGFGRTQPGLNPKAIDQFYARYYPLTTLLPETVKRQVKVQSRWRAWLSGTNNTAHWHIKPGEKILDIGSASGVSLLEIKQLGGKPYGVEPDPNAAQLAKALDLPVHIGFIEDQPFGNEQFDVVTASQVLEHTPDPRVFLQSIARRLTADGRVIISFPNANALYRKILGRRWLHWHIPYHYNFFTRSSFVQLAQSVGLQVVQLRTITPNLWTLIQLKMLVKKPREGKMHPLWSAQRQGALELAINPGRLTGYVKGGLALAIVPIVTIMNRTIDSTGQGESFLAFLTKEK